MSSARADTLVVTLLLRATGAIFAAGLLGGCHGPSQMSGSSFAPPPALTATLRRSDPALATVEAERAAAQSEGSFVLVGVGDSMQPYFLPGTAIVVHPATFFMLRSGMPVVFVDNQGRHVAHVLVRKNPRGWRTRGMNNAFEDAGWVTAENLVGVIRHAFVPQIGASPTSLGAAESEIRPL